MHIAVNKMHQTLKDKLAILLSREPQTIAQLKRALGTKYTYDVIRNTIAEMSSIIPSGFTSSNCILYTIKSDGYSNSDFDFRK